MTGNRLILAADIGTSSLKAALVSYDGGLFGFEREGYTAPGVSGPVRGADWEAAFIRAARGLISRLPVGATIAAVAISGNGPSLVALDSRGTELSVLHWHNRASAAFRRPGTTSLFLPHLARFREEEADLFSSTSVFLSAQEWLSSQLGADRVTVLPSAEYPPFYWDPSQLSDYGVDTSLLPPFVVTGERTGSVSEASSLATGIPAGTPVIASATDFFMALLGSGVIVPGRASDRAGSSEGINLCTEKPGPKGELLTLPHYRKGLWTVDAILPASGKLFEDFRIRSGLGGLPYAEVLASLHEAALNPARASETALEGVRLLETLGFMVQRGIDTLEYEGFPVGALRISGGQAKSPIWNQLKANILGRRLDLPLIIDTELAGNTAASLLALGEEASLESAVERVVRIERSFEPDEAAHRAYREKYQAWVAS